MKAAATAATAAARRALTAAARAYEDAREYALEAGADYRAAVRIWGAEPSLEYKQARRAALLVALQARRNLAAAEAAVR